MFQCPRFIFLLNYRELNTNIDIDCPFLFPLVGALQSLKKALQLPNRLGWNGDPCIPQQHPWSRVDCRYDNTKGNWYIDGM